MWELRTIHIENIVSFKEADFEFNQGLCTLIFGHNEDNAAQPCNGSGKSSLIESISFALTGEPLRKVKVDEIINDEAEDALVKLVMHNSHQGKTMEITRCISRKSPQTIICQMFDLTHEEIEQDKMVQPTVADYNKMILSEIGLSKEDIYSYFILCDNKYKSFFDSSDKDKKEIVNRFSNGVLVDGSIEKVKEDMDPVADELKDAIADQMEIQGSISALREQIKTADEKNANQKANREAKLAEYDAKIAEIRCKKREESGRLQKAQERMEVLNHLLEEAKSLNVKEWGFDELYENLVTQCKNNGLQEISDYHQNMQSLKDKAAQLQSSIDKSNDLIEDFNKQIKAVESEYEVSNAQYNQLFSQNTEASKEDKKLMASIQSEIAAIDKQLDAFDTELKRYEQTKKSVQEQLVAIGNILHGTITCPKCSHQFLLSSDGKSLSDVQQEKKDADARILELDHNIESINKQYDTLDASAGDKDNQIQDIKQKMKERNNALEEMYLELRKTKRSIDTLTDSRNKALSKLNVDESVLANTTVKIDGICQAMVAEYIGIIEGNVAKGNGYVSGCQQNISFHEGQIKQYQDAREELEKAEYTDFKASLEAGILQYEKLKAEADKNTDEIQKRYDQLNGQLTNFNMFKSYLANKKLDALSYIVNDFLEQIGSDIRLRLEGYKVLRTGRLKENISIQVLRDGVDIGSYYKRSGGERARLNLASILALQKLTNSNCEEGKGLDIIICDEVLDKSDEVGIMSYCEALNKLHQTSLIITQGQVSENYPHKTVITKSKGFSRIG